MKNFLTMLLCVTFIYSCSINHSELDKTSNFASSVETIKDAGLYDSFFTSDDSRSIETEINVSIEDVKYFINNPDEVMYELEQNDSDNGSEFIAALYSGATIGEIADILAVTSVEMANEYLSNVEYEINTINRSLTGETLSITAIKDIKLAYSSDEKKISRGPWSADLEWETI